MTCLSLIRRRVRSVSTSGVALSRAADTDCPAIPCRGLRRSGLAACRGSIPRLSKTPFAMALSRAAAKVIVGNEPNPIRLGLRFHLNRNNHLLVPVGPKRRTNPRTNGSEKSRDLPVGLSPAIWVAVNRGEPRRSRSWGRLCGHFVDTFPCNERHRYATIYHSKLRRDVLRKFTRSEQKTL
jgi:hypothetical protein